MQIKINFCSRLEWKSRNTHRNETHFELSNNNNNNNKYSALGPVWARTWAQSGDWYGSGTLHPGQILRGSMPLLSPVSNLLSFTLDCGVAAFANFLNGLPFFPEDVNGISFRNACPLRGYTVSQNAAISPPWNFKIPKGVYSQTESILICPGRSEPWMSYRVYFYFARSEKTSYITREGSLM